MWAALKAVGSGMLYCENTADAGMKGCGCKRRIKVTTHKSNMRPGHINKRATKQIPSSSSWAVISGRPCLLRERSLLQHMRPVSSAPGAMEICMLIRRSARACVCTCTDMHNSTDQNHCTQSSRLRRCCDSGFGSAQLSRSQSRQLCTEKRQATPFSGMCTNCSAAVLVQKPSLGFLCMLEA